MEKLSEENMKNIIILTFLLNENEVFFHFVTRFSNVVAIVLNFPSRDLRAHNKFTRPRWCDAMDTNYCPNSAP